MRFTARWHGEFKASVGSFANVARFIYPEAGSASGYYDFLKKQYEDGMKVAQSSENKVRIPKILHQIWMGSGSKIPANLLELRKTFLDNHPGWQHKLWTDDDLKKFDFVNKELFFAAKTYGERSDIWRYEILYKFGGVYADMDFICYKPLDDFNKAFDFYVGIHPVDGAFIGLNNAFIACVPGHPILKYAIDYFPTMKAQEKIIRSEISPHIYASGPVLITRAFYMAYGTGNYRNIALPTTYFYPMGLSERRQSPSIFERPESYVMHLWHGTCHRASKKD